MGHHLDDVFPLKLGLQLLLVFHGVVEGQNGGDIVVAEIPGVVRDHEQGQLAGVIGAAEPGQVGHARLNGLETVLVLGQRFHPEGLDLDLAPGSLVHLVGPPRVHLPVPGLLGHIGAVLQGYGRGIRRNAGRRQQGQHACHSQRPSDPITLFLHVVLLHSELQMNVKFTVRSRSLSAPPGSPSADDSASHESIPPYLFCSY